MSTLDLQKIPTPKQKKSHLLLHTRSFTLPQLLNANYYMQLHPSGSRNFMIWRKICIDHTVNSSSSWMSWSKLGTKNKFWSYSQKKTLCTNIYSVTRLVMYLHWTRKQLEEKQRPCDQPPQTSRKAAYSRLRPRVCSQHTDESSQLVVQGGLLPDALVWLHILSQHTQPVLLITTLLLQQPAAALPLKSGAQ